MGAHLCSFPCGEGWQRAPSEALAWILAASVSLSSFPSFPRVGTLIIKSCEDFFLNRFNLLTKDWRIAQFAWDCFPNWIRDTRFLFVPFGFFTLVLNIIQQLWGTNLAKARLGFWGHTFTLLPDETFGPCIEVKCKRTHETQTATLCTDSCQQFLSSETCYCESQWTKAEQSRMQLITEHPDVLSAAFYIITSNCYLRIHISCIYV